MLNDISKLSDSVTEMLAKLLLTVLVFMRERVEKYGVKRNGNSRYKASKYQRYSLVF